MIRTITDRGLSNHLPYPQGHVLSNQQGLSAAEYTRRNKNRFIDGVIAQIDKGASIRDKNQKNKMAETEAADRITDAVPMSAPYPMVGGNANLLRNRANNVTMVQPSPKEMINRITLLHLRHHLRVLRCRKVYLLIHHRMVELLSTNQPS